MRSLITETDMTFLEARPLAEAVAQGKFTLCIFCGRDLSTIKNDGAPVENNWPHALKEGATIGVGGETMYFVNNAPHPKAAQLFINWLLLPDSALLAQKASGADSLRIDIPNDGVDEGDIRKDDQEYYWAEVNPEHTAQISPAQELMRRNHGGGRPVARRRQGGGLSGLRGVMWSPLNGSPPPGR